MLAINGVVSDRMFAVLLALIVMSGTVIRLPGVFWLHHQVPEPGLSLHPDELRVLTDAKNFENSGHRKTYVAGMSTHIYVVMELARRVLHKELDPIIVVRTISLLYGILTIGLVSLIVGIILKSQGLALLTSAFLSLAPLHIINSHFGTPDSAATFYFYLVIFLGWVHAKTRSELSFVAFVASIGICLAIKFFIAVFVPLGILLLTEKHRLARAVEAALIVAGSFSIASFFNFTPWEFNAFLYRLMYDNVEIVGGKTWLENAFLYSQRSLSSVGLVCSVFVIIGVVILFRAAIQRFRQRRFTNGVWATIKQAGAHPNTVLIVPLLVHLYLVLDLGVSETRHLLPFLPILCLIASIGLLTVVRPLRIRKPVLVTCFVAVFGYQLYNGIRLEQVFIRDIRKDMATWMENNLTEKDTVSVFLDYARVKGVNQVLDRRDGDLKVNSTYFATCDLEYDRYFGNEDASKIFHAYGGQKRLIFFR
ncbi:MAG: phospholipid carrier-dependent glycosyltransferase, partial [Nitrososphaera sp.]|nr:phospholipid carrier-dependent glycosyltransferase [Nitrososphaera sp.]